MVSRTLRSWTHWPGELGLKCDMVCWLSWSISSLFSKMVCCLLRLLVFRLSWEILTLFSELLLNTSCIILALPSLPFSISLSSPFASRAFSRQRILPQSQLFMASANCLHLVKVLVWNLSTFRLFSRQSFLHEVFENWKHDSFVFWAHQTELGFSSLKLQQNLRNLGSFLAWSVLLDFPSFILLAAKEY